MRAAVVMAMVTGSGRDGDSSGGNCDSDGSSCRNGNSDGGSGGNGNSNGGSSGNGDSNGSGNDSNNGNLVASKTMVATAMVGEKNNTQLKR